MITIEAIAKVTTDSKVTIQLPANIPPGKHKIILMIDENPESNQDSTWDQFEELIERCQIDIGIEDLTHKHDHYFHGTPKRETYP